MMKISRYSHRKAFLVTASLALVFAIACWLPGDVPYDFEVISVEQEPSKNMRVKLKFTNRSDAPLSLSLVEHGLSSVSYAPANEAIPKTQPWRAFAFSGAIHHEQKSIPPGGSLIIEDHEYIRKSGDTFYAMWQPPPRTDWIADFRREVSSKAGGPFPVTPVSPVSFTPVPPTGWREKLRAWLSPDPPKSLVSKKFTAP